jgi:hypothetical protein
MFGLKSLPLMVIFGSTLLRPTHSLTYSDWLSEFQATRIVDLPVIPASHNSGAAELGNNPTWQGDAMWNYAKTQNASIAEQLGLGIRMLDLRLHVMYDNVDYVDQIRISHTYDSASTLPEVLDSVKTFLDEHTTEFVILYIRIDSVYPLLGNETAKHILIETTLANSGISFASYSAGDLKAMTVGDLAGKALLMGIGGDAFRSTNSRYSFVEASTNYSVCDIWELETITAAQAKLSSCFPEVPPSGEITGILSGYAIDGQLDGLPPSVGSVKMNDWFFNNFVNNPIWIMRKDYPVGILMIDFVNLDYMATIIDYAMNAEISINDQSSTINAKQSVNHVHLQWKILLALLASAMAIN